MIRSTIQFFYTAGPRIAIKSPLDRKEIESRVERSRENGMLLELESLPENPRDETPSAFVYLDLIGLAWVVITEEKEKPHIIP